MFTHDCLLSKATFKHLTAKNNITYQLIIVVINFALCNEQFPLDLVLCEIVQKIISVFIPQQSLYALSGVPSRDEEHQLASITTLMRIFLPCVSLINFLMVLLNSLRIR